MGFTLDDALHRFMAGDDTLDMPGPSELEALAVGDYAKLIFVFDGDKKERMWVRVTDNSFPFFEGILDNDSYYLPALVVGEPISFEAQHIADLLIRKDN